MCFPAVKKQLARKLDFIFRANFTGFFSVGLFSVSRWNEKHFQLNLICWTNIFLKRFFAEQPYRKKNRWNLPGKWSYFHFSGNFLTKSGSNQGFEQAETSALPYLVYLPWRMKNRSDSGWFTWLHSDEQLLILGYIIFHRVFLSGSPSEFFYGK